MFEVVFRNPFVLCILFPAMAYGLIMWSIHRNNKRNEELHKMEKRIIASRLRHLKNARMNSTNNNLQKEKRNAWF